MIGRVAKRKKKKKVPSFIKDCSGYAEMNFHFGFELSRISIYFIKNRASY